MDIQQLKTELDLWIQKDCFNAINGQAFHWYNKSFYGYGFFIVL